MNTHETAVNSETSAGAAAAAIDAMTTATGLNFTVVANHAADGTDADLAAAMLLSAEGPTGSVLMAMSETIAQAIVNAADVTEDDPQAAWNELSRVGLDASHTFVAALSSNGQLIGPVTSASPVNELPADAAEWSGVRLNVEISGAAGALWWLLPLPVQDGPAITPVAYPELGGGTGASMPAEISLLSDVSMDVTVELGRTVMRVRDVLDLSEGSVVELDRPIGAHVDVLVNGSQIARGEVVVIDDVLGVRITGVSAESRVTQ